MSGYLSKKGVYISATDIGTESSPTYTGLTLSGLTASTVIYSNASKALTSLANSAGYLLNDGSGGLSWGAVSFAGYLKADRSIALTGVTGPALLAIDADEKFATLDGVAAGQVLASGGVGAIPVFTASPTLTSLTLGAGTVSAPSINFGDSNTGIYASGADNIDFSINGIATMNLSANTLVTYSGKYILLGQAIYLYPHATNVLQIGIDAASPVDQTIQGADGSGADKIGGAITLRGGASTGTGAGGSVKHATSYVAGTGSTANTYYTRQFIDGKVHSVANNTATAMFSITCADGNAVGGYINYTVEVTDGTDIQIESGTFTFAATNKAVETWVTDADKGTFSQAVSASTLAVTWAVDTATADTLKVTVNSNSGLTPTSSKVQFQIFLNSPKVITIL